MRQAALLPEPEHQEPQARQGLQREPAAAEEAARLAESVADSKQVFDDYRSPSASADGLCAFGLHFKYL